ncbi:7318_t:CDS:1, partial [Funneliformis geosporum]
DSLKDLGLSSLWMGFAWLQTDQNWPSTSFHSSFYLYNPSSLLAELLAIIFTTFVTPSHSTIHIFTDSLS